MRKKIIALILSMVFVFGVTSIMVIAENTPKIVVGDANAKAGYTVSVDISIENNPGINTFSLGFDYDTTRLNLTGVTVASELGGQFQYAKKAVWLNSSDSTYNGKILTLTFSVLSNAADGDATVAVIYNVGDISNYDEDDVDFTLKAGKITIGSTQTTKPASEQTTGETTTKNNVDKGIISVSTVSAKAGETAVVKVTMDKNPGINTFSLGFNYDTSKLTLNNVAVASELGGQFQYSKKAVWLNSADTTYTGKILTLTFKVLDGTAAGDYPVAVTYSAGDIANYNEDDVDFTLNAGKVTVTEESVTPSATANIILSDAKGRIGQTVTMKVSLEKAETVKSIGITGITYDTDALELVSGKWLLDNSTISSVDVAKKTAAIAFSNETNVNKDIFELTFKVKAGAEDGDYPVTVSATAKNGETAIGINNGTGVFTVYSYILGDTDDDGVVTSDDAINLLYYTLMPELYSVNQDCDFNGDGVVTSDDAIYLLYYTLMPELYPLG